MSSETQVNTAELQAIRDDDSRWSDGYVAADPSGLVAQRRTLLALYDAHEADKLRLSDEVRRLREALREAINLRVALYRNHEDYGQFKPAAEIIAEDKMWLSRWNEALGSQP